MGRRVLGQVAVGALATALLAACTVVPPSEPAPTPSPDRGGPVDVAATHARPPGMPAWLDVPPTPAPCPPVTVLVDDAEGLQRALDRARPGDVVGLEDGRYAGTFRAARPGTSDEPVHVCGGPGAVVDGGDVTSGYALHLDGTSHWVLQGFTVTGGQKGVMVDGATDVVLRGLHVHGVGDEAVHLRRATTDSLVEGLLVHDTGLREPEFGEGLYVGSAHTNWCDLTDCGPDRSDRNRLVRNVVWDTTAEAVDVKEGTTGGEVRDNRFDGSAMRGDVPDSWVALKGNDWLVVGNQGRHSPDDGFQVSVERRGWGRGNVLERNRGRLDDDDGVLVAVAREVRAATRVTCSNALLGDAGRVTDVRCG